jgi:hypothetical protein
MPDEFKPEASVDFEQWVESAAPPNGSANGAAPQPPPEQDRPADPPRPPIAQARNSAPHGGDPILQLETVATNIPLIYSELGDINAGLMRAQLTNALTLGGMLLLAILVYKFSHDKE